jgi:siroheme synthase-like protein
MARDRNRQGFQTDDSPDRLRFLPVGLNVHGKDCLVVGGGSVGTRKVGTLTRAGALVTVVSPDVSADLAGQVETGRIRWVKDRFCEKHLGDAFLVVAATDNQTLNADITRLAAQRGMLACDASSAERSDVIFGALLTDDDLTVAVFTDGHDPARARRTRDRIAQLMSGESGRGAPSGQVP